MTKSDRQRIFENTCRLIAVGNPVEAACRASGLGVATYYKWAKSGVPGESAPSKSTGRPAAVALTDQESAALRLHVLRKGSGRLGVEDFLNDPRCQAGTADVLLACLDRAASTRSAVSFPLSVRRIISLTQDEKAQFRSRRATLRCEFVGHRGMFLSDGTPVLPGDIFESDDMSSNEYFRFVDPDTGEAMLGRQNLITQDVYSLNCLSGSPIGRFKDAYRVEDIAEHMLATVQAWGLPLYWRLERGPWENNFIDGFPLDSLGRAGERWGALNHLFNIERAWTPNQKGGVEGSFRHLQNLLAHPHGSPTIGRYAGEFEMASKWAMRAKKGRESALAKFWGIADAANWLCQGMERFNQEQKKRETLDGGRYSPEELWAERPARRELKAEDEWLFLPVKKSAVVRNGQLSVTAPHYGNVIHFAVNGVAENLYLPTGHNVLIAFHPGHPEKGCAVFNADMGARNRSAWRFGQFLFTAPHVDKAPQISLDFPDAPTAKRKANAAMVSEFRAVRAAGQISAPKISQARDGLGNALVVAMGASPAAAPPVPSGRQAAALQREESPADVSAPRQSAAEILAGLE
jgi:hypothetical protein